jgi:restriction system protein
MCQPNMGATREGSFMIDQLPVLSITREIWPILALAVAVMALKLVITSPRFKGRVGEARVTKTLQRRLDPETSMLLTDVTLPSGSGTTQIDHIAIIPAGIFVIETKNMSGWIFGNAESRRWTQVLHRKKTGFQNPLRQNHKHIKAVEAVTGVDRAMLFNLVVFAGHATPKTPFPETVFWKPRQMVDWLLEQSATRLSPDEMAEVRDRIDAARLAPGRHTDRVHIAHVKTRVGNRQ